MAEAAQTETTQPSQTEQTQSSSEVTQASQSSSEATQASTTAHEQSREGHDGKHVHHGRTPAAWAGVALAMLGFLLGGYAVLVQNWTVFWVAAGICVVALIVAGVMQKMGYGAD
jgi:Flp pilus assembly protein TadB